MMAEIRLASEKDLELILPLAQAYHEFEGLHVSDSERESAIHTLITNHTLGGIWLIHHENEQVGYLALCKGYSIEFGGSDAFIDEFYIRPEFRGKGLGKHVLDLIKNEAKKLGVQALHLEVARDNIPTQKLYSTAKFQLREKYVLMSVKLS